MSMMDRPPILVHFAPYGSTNAACQETVPRSAGWNPSTADYEDDRFTTRRKFVTCPECSWQIVLRKEPSAAAPNHLVEEVAKAIWSEQIGGLTSRWPFDQAPVNTKRSLRDQARVAIEVARAQILKQERTRIADLLVQLPTARVKAWLTGWDSISLREALKIVNAEEDSDG